MGYSQKGVKDEKLEHRAGECCHQGGQVKYSEISFGIFSLGWSLVDLKYLNYPNIRIGAGEGFLRNLDYIMVCF